MYEFLQKMKNGEDASTRLKQFRINIKRNHTLRNEILLKEYSLKSLNKRILIPNSPNPYQTYAYGYTNINL